MNKRTLNTNIQYVTQDVYGGALSRSSLPMRSLLFFLLLGVASSAVDEFLGKELASQDAPHMPGAQAVNLGGHPSHDVAADAADQGKGCLCEAPSAAAVVGATAVCIARSPWCPRFAPVHEDSCLLIRYSPS